MRLRIADKEYPLAALNKPTLRDLIPLQDDLARMGMSVTTWGEIEQVAQEFQGLKPDEAIDHPRAFFMIGLTVWASRCAAGEHIRFSEAVDVAIDEIEFLADPGDDAPKGKAKAGSAKRGARKPGGSTSRPKSIHAL